MIVFPHSLALILVDLPMNVLMDVSLLPNGLIMLLVCVSRVSFDMHDDLK